MAEKKKIKEKNKKISTKTKIKKVSSSGVKKLEVKAKAQKQTAGKNISNKKELKKTSKKPVSQVLELGKRDVIKAFSTKSGDTGSPEVQVAILTFKILKLQEHLAQNPKDNHSRRGLLKIVSKRRRILNYIQSIDEKRYIIIKEKISLFQEKKSL